MRAMLILMLFVLLKPASAQSPGLKDIKTVYVDSFGNAVGADIIREKVINRLAQSSVLTLVLEPEKADAILTGVGQVTQEYAHSASVDRDGGTASGGTRYDATLVVRLVSKDKRILWTDEAKPGRFFTQSVSSSVADKVAKNLLKAIDRETKPAK